MPRRSQASPAAPVPFEPTAARAVRAELGLSPAMVARALGDSYALPVPPSLVISWEVGAAHPTERELIALARVLWCLPGRLMGGRAVSLRDHRLALDLPRDEVARRLRITRRDYARMEERWDGDRLQTRELAQVLQLSPRTLIRACDREQRLDELLLRATDGRWQAQVRPVHELIPVLSEEWISHALQALSAERSTSSALWGGPATQPAEEIPQEEPAERFWTLVEPATT
ncbi:helix-turn-helix domain-containing protein [Streptacidiphilus jiangxiensis]|uniref:Helix-turn-helix n=1 Tax=Streptacidiphilus jiangxiensis TaxID=235985 RepID=A0A1H7LW09_STRJI|nr:helix-turn-helix transcriptional regulator [Streptacidiphilus jiangxiensis]SEL02908.1 Helix-turn-helix [Streptacidiphilus jiangxiensis]